MGITSIETRVLTGRDTAEKGSRAAAASADDRRYENNLADLAPVWQKDEYFKNYIIKLNLKE